MNLVEMYVEAVGERHRRAGFDVGFSGLVDRFLGDIGHQQTNQVGIFHRIAGRHQLHAVLLGPGPAFSTLTQTNHHIETAVPEVQGMGSALASIAQYCNAGTLKGTNVHILFGVNLHRQTPFS
jgi:hypothetical protein